MTVNIVVPVKYVPDAQNDRAFTDALTVDRRESILSELDEYPLEAALALREAAPEQEISIIAVTMGPEDASAALKKALQMGADAAFHVSDDALAGSDALATSAVLAAVVRRVGEEHGGVDLVLTGMSSTDGETALVPPQLAERLDFALVTHASSLEWAVPGRELTATRASGDETQRVSAGLPAVVSVTDQANEPRYPNFKAIMAAKKKPSSTLTLAQLDMDVSTVGRAAATITVRAAVPRPPREQGTVIHDEGDAGVQLVEFLAAHRLI